MKTIEALIELWESWKPSIDFVCPSQVACYYWKLYLAGEKQRPLFPNGELNDVIAVIAGSKPSATIDLGDDNTFLEQLTRISIDRNIYSRYLRDRSLLIFARLNILDEMELAFKNQDKFIIGMLLGYPEKSVERFLQKFHKIAQNAQILKTNSIEECLKMQPTPKFKIGDEWFAE